MSFARASAISAAALGLFLAGCSSHAGSSLVPTTPATDAAASSPIGTDATATSPTSALSTLSTATQTSSVTVRGTVSNLSATKFVVYAGAPYGYVPVNKTSSTSVTTHGASLANGSYAIVTGTGALSSTVTAATVNVYPTNPSGTTGSSGTSSASTTMKHILTADYLLGRYGTHSVTPARAAQYLSWAQTTTADANSIAAAGIKTQVYVDPNRWATNDPMYYGSTEAMYAHTCGGARVTSVYHGLTRYVTNPNSAVLQSHYYSYLSSLTKGIHVDSVFEDDAGPLSMYSTYTPFNAMPCSYSDTSWIAGGSALDAHSPVPVWVNGLGGLNGHNPSVEVGLVNTSSVAGGVYEHCFTDNSELKMDAWEWQAIENTQLEVLRGGNTFMCMERNTNAASTQTPERIWGLASFLLTYDPSRSVLWTEFGTPSGLHVMPESKLVALNPVAAQPAAIAQLQTPSGNYAREYNTCYIGGVSVGPCAAVVNIDRYSAHAFPYPGKYGHTLAISGNGVLDGGSVSTAGGAPPASLPAKTAYIVFK